MSEELIALENLNAESLFKGSDEGVTALLSKIEKEATSIVPDISTAKGRKEIISLANKVTTCKTYLDKAGKEIVDDLKRQPKIIDAKRKKMRDFLSDLKDEVRKPVTEWEQAEENRVESHKRLLQFMVDEGERARTNWQNMTLDELQNAFKSVDRVNLGESWDEFEAEAENAKETAISDIRQALVLREDEDRKNAELEELRAEKAAREAKEREDNLKREAEEKAKRDSAAALEAAERAKEEAERRAKEAEENAARQALEAEERVKREAEEQAAREKLEAEERERNIKHRNSINRSAIDALTKVGLSKEDAKTAIQAVSKGMIPNVEIKY